MIESLLQGVVLIILAMAAIVLATVFIWIVSTITELVWNFLDERFG